MTRKRHLHIGTAIMEKIEVLSKRCVFPNPDNSPDKKIRAAFKRLREVVSGFGFDPDSLLHIGIPVMDGQALLTYDCCIEFPFPMDEPPSEIHLTTLPGGPYIILRMEKKPQVIARSLRQFIGDYIPENEIIPDPDRPTLEIYYEHEMEYCLPILA